MARPKKDPNSVPTQQRILRAAENEFGKHGFVRTRLEDIAEQVGIRRPSLLYHFKTKEALYECVVQELFTALRTQLVSEMKPGEFSDFVLNLTQSFIQFVEQRPSFAPIVLREIIDGGGPVHTILLHQITPVLDVIEGFVRMQGANSVPEGVSVRTALVHVSSNILLQQASGTLRTPLWGDQNTTIPLVEQLFLGKTASMAQ